MCNITPRRIRFHYKIIIEHISRGHCAEKSELISPISWAGEHILYTFACMEEVYVNNGNVDKQNSIRLVG